MKKYDVTALGELLIDFTENGMSSQGNPMFEANPGGAPCNVLAMLAKLGHKTAFIGKVGNDFLGSSLKMPSRRWGSILLIFGWMMRCTRRWLWYIRTRTATGIFPFIVIRGRI